VSPARFECRVCQVQESRVTCVDGNWQSHVAPTQGSVREALSSFLLEWEYLDTAGEGGCTLVGAAGGVGGDSNAHVVHLRRDRS